MWLARLSLCVAKNESSTLSQLWRVAAHFSSDYEPIKSFSFMLVFFKKIVLQPSLTVNVYPDLSSHYGTCMLIWIAGTRKTRIQKWFSCTIVMANQLFMYPHIIYPQIRNIWLPKLQQYGIIIRNLELLLQNFLQYMLYLPF